MLYFAHMQPNELVKQASALLSATKTVSELEALAVRFLGRRGEIARLFGKLGEMTLEERKSFGEELNAAKRAIESGIKRRRAELEGAARGVLGGSEWIDATQPGLRPPEGHLHLTTHAIREITRIFERIGFYRVRYPEVDWDWYAFESLNMPKDHPARDEWETFFIARPETNGSERREGQLLGLQHREDGFSDVSAQGNAGDRKTRGGPTASERYLQWGEVATHPKYGKMVLIPHTSNGQVREMESGRMPIRMINIAKCYRRQSDVSHVPMFHQFEGLYIDKGVALTHLKGVFDHFVHSFFGKDRKTRLRPHHFRFTEPSVELDISCDLCAGTGKKDGARCRMCKSGWLELGGAGMINHNVLRAGKIDPTKYSGFAFGWGVERTAMMRSGLKIDDIRILYKNDLRFLKQF